MKQHTTLNVAIVGGGPGCKAIMDMIFAEKLSELRMKVIGVASINSRAVGYLYAKEKGIYTTEDYRELYKLKGLDMIIELTGRDEVANEISQTKPDQVRFMDHVAARLFWDVFQVEEKRLLERKLAEGELRKHRDHLDSLVKERTGELSTTNEKLQQEVTERKEAELQIKRQTEFLNLVLESLPYPFCVVSASDQTVKLANSCANAGRLSGDVTCHSLTHEGDGLCGLNEHSCPVDMIKETKRPVVLEYVHHDRHGNPRNVEMHAYPIFDDEGNVSQVIESSVDITDRKRAEEDRERLISALQEALSKVRTLSGLLPICASCKKIRDDDGYWNRIEEYIKDHSEAEFSHSICPECVIKFYPELRKKDD
jgi:PAS domain-containing protein